MTRTSPTAGVTRCGDVHVFRFPHLGVLDTDRLWEVRRSIGELTRSEARPKVVLDMQDVVLLSSEAIGMIVALGNAMRPRGGRLHLANISHETYAVFEITRLQSLVSIFESTRAAIDAFKQPG